MGGAIHIKKHVIIFLNPAANNFYATAPYALYDPVDAQESLR